MHVAAGRPFTATLLAPPGLEGIELGARIEVPITRAIVGYWRPGRLEGMTWTVVLEAPPAQPLTPPDLGDDLAIADALDAGEFEIVWMDRGLKPLIEVFVPLFVHSGRWPGLDGEPPEDWPEPDVKALTPDVDDISILVRTRTYTDGVEEHVIFTDQTRPNVDDVERLLAQTVPAVLSQLRARFPVSCYDDVKHVIALYTAILIEGSFFREQLNESQVELYRDLINSQLVAINRSIDSELAGLYAGALRLV